MHIAYNIHNFSASNSLKCFMINARDVLTWVICRMISIQFVYTATAPPYIKYKTVNPQLRSFYPFDDYLSVSKCAIHISSLFKLKAIET